jgi:hypothetical protein
VYIGFVFRIENLKACDDAAKMSDKKWEEEGCLI